jgi:hypothetical protein
MKHYRDLPSRSKHLDIFYHGTIIENAAKICKEGLKRGTPERMGYVSREDPLGVDRFDDCVRIVNFSRNRKDAIFFACAWREMKRGEPGQAIFEVDANKLDKNMMLFRNMFGKPWAEVKYFLDVPPDAIKNVFIRKFDWIDDDLKVTEKDMSCDEILEKGDAFWEKI